MSELERFYVCGKQFTINHNETCKAFTGKVIERVITSTKEKAESKSQRSKRLASPPPDPNPATITNGGNG